MTSARGAFVARFAKSVSASGCRQIAIVAVGLIVWVGKYVTDYANKAPSAPATPVAPVASP